MSEEDKQQLDELTKALREDMSTVVRLLIRRAYYDLQYRGTQQAIFGPH